MPQGDFINFSSTTFWVGLTFLGGYFLFVGWWVPRLLLLSKTRHWLQQFSQTAHHETAASAPTVSRTKFLASATAGLTSPEFYPVVTSAVWPESFLFFVEFVALVTVLSTLTFPTVVEKLPAPHKTSVATAAEGNVIDRVVNLVGLWSAKRAFVYRHFFYKVNEVTTRVVTSLAGGLPSVAPGLGTRLKRAALQVPHD